MENSNFSKGKIIVIEGLDGSGKATQSKILAERLSKEYKVRKLTFPDYSGEGSALVRMYLGGEFGDDPSCVNPYAAASFYAVDRVASYLKDWKCDYDEGTVFVLDRYSTSNMIYMTSKLKREEWDSFISWLDDYEFEKLSLPRPSGVIYLDMPTEVSQKLMSGRYNNDESKKDLHEKNLDYLKSCRETALFTAEKLNWNVIPCAKNSEPLSIEEISEAVYNTAKKYL